MTIRVKFDNLFSDERTLLHFETEYVTYNNNRDNYLDFVHLKMFDHFTGRTIYLLSRDTTLMRDPFEYGSPVDYIHPNVYIEIGFILKTGTMCQTMI